MYRQDLNDRSYLNESDFYKYSTGLRALVDASEIIPLSSRILISDCQDLPLTKNWLSEGKVSNVKDQLFCGSSYLMSAVSAVESAVSIEYGTSPVEFSTQHCLECMKNITNNKLHNACSGGRPEW